jgi:ribonuclease D
LKRDCSFEFANVFDTMISAQLLGYKAIGLAAVIDHHFGVNVPKDEQRSDWSRRPLTDRQLTYAVGDVIYLARLARKLERELEKAGRLSWAQQEFATLEGREWPLREFDKEGYLKIKGARKLDPSSLGVLRELYLMRDARAREIDRPPFKVLGNRTLLEIADVKPSRDKQLGKIVGITDLLIRRMGENILAAVEAGVAEPHPPIQKSANPPKRRMDRKSERRVTRLKSWRAGRAKDLDLDPGVLCPNASLEAIAWINPASADELEGASELKGWFVREFAGEVVDVLAGPDEAGDPQPTERPAKAAAKSPSKPQGMSHSRSGADAKKKSAKS